MGNYSELYFTNSSIPVTGKELEESAPYLTAKYRLPLFWLAMFDSSDIVDGPITGGDSWPYLVKHKDQALRLLGTRNQWLQENFPMLNPVWLEQFKNFIIKTPYPFVHLNTEDIGCVISTSSEWRIQLEAMLGIFFENRAPPPTFFERLLKRSKTNDSWSTFNRIFGSAHEGQESKEPWTYCGASATEQLAPWESEFAKK